MPSELHVHPDRLRGHAHEAAALSEELRAALTAGGRAADPVLREEQERLCRSVSRAVRELAELGAVLAGVAERVEEVDSDVAAALRRLTADGTGTGRVPG